MDLSLYKRGVKITVAGEVEGLMPGEKIESVSDSTYRYPLLSVKKFTSGNIASIHIQVFQIIVEPGNINTMEEFYVTNLAF